MGNLNPRCTWSNCDCPETDRGTICKYEQPDEYIALKARPSVQVQTAPATAPATTPAATLNDLELRIVAALGDVWNEYLRLEESASDREEFMNSIHALQRQIMCRLARRVHPGVFRDRWR